MGPNLFDPKLTRLACLLSFASLFDPKLARLKHLFKFSKEFFLLSCENTFQPTDCVRPAGRRIRIGRFDTGLSQKGLIVGAIVHLSQNRN